MKNRCMKHGMMIIAAVLLVAAAFAGAASADTPVVHVWNSSGEYTLVKNVPIYGDAGGTATLIDDTGDSWTLELNNFKASRTDNTPIINGSLPNLTIVLRGDSEISGKYCYGGNGLLRVWGNLTITNATGESNPKLTVKNNWDMYSVDAITSSQDITITSINLTIIANSDNGGASGIGADNKLSIYGENTVINLDTHGNGSSTSCALNGNEKLIIASGAKITANVTHDCSGSTNALSGGEISISSGNVSIKAKGDLGSNAIAISKSLLIDGDSDITAIAEGPSGFAIAGIPFSSEPTLTINACKKIVLQGSNSSFAMSNINKLQFSNPAYFTFTNDSMPSDYATFMSNWHTDWLYSGFLSVNASDWKKATIIMTGPAPATYPIWITNATGTYQLSDAMTKVFGDGGSGYANLTAVSGDTYTLELNNFKVSNAHDITLPIINASVANLTIVLKGDSNLTGSLANNGKGLINSVGNLTITKDGDGKLLINNVAGSSGNAIYAENDLTIHAGTVNATASMYAIYTNAGNVSITDGKITATATGSSGAAINASNNVIINAGTVTANAGKYAIYAHSGDITIGGGTVNATANNFAIATKTGNVTIGGGTVIATTNSGAGVSIYAPNTVIIEGGTITASANGNDAYAIYTDGNVTINGGTINAIATTGGFGIVAEKNLSITDCTQIQAIGGRSSFYYRTSLEIEDLSEHVFSNATNPGNDPTTYDAFKNNWYNFYGSLWASNYTAVKIEKNTGTTDGSIKVKIEGSSAGIDPVNLTLTPVSTGTSGIFDIGTNTTVTFKPITPGVYNLVATYTNNSVGHNLTKQVTVTPSNRTTVTFKLITTNVTTEVTTSQGTGASIPNVAVDGLDKLAEAAPAPAAGKETVFAFNAVAEAYNTSDVNQTTLMTNITANHSNAAINFLNFTVTNSTRDIASGVTESVQTVPDTVTLMNIYMAYDMNGRENLQVWRIHDGDTKEFRELAAGGTPADGFYTRDGNKGIYIYSRYFSTYTVSSTAIAGPSGPSYSGGSSSKNYGGSMWTENPNPTVAPTAAPTVAPTAAPVYDTPTQAPTTQPTTKQTQKSPAPVAGLLVGLGVAAVLLRLRR